MTDLPEYEDQITEETEIDLSILELYSFWNTLE